MPSNRPQQRCPLHRAKRDTEMLLTLDTTCHRDAPHIRHDVTQGCHSHRTQQDTEMLLASDTT
ncbi:hypothetical protein DPMN_108093 [Dreissena polymorpha]|uniref:Uncharacterized protein n=1 Tax=Dreissena polymorpha TaxID=45954 RepID=A0A9D4K7Z1_DREPO|nr:hypothetical protein DPMN_108093 [Dreissena polymorpha]